VALTAPVWATPAAADDGHPRLAFSEVDLVSNIPGQAAVTDANVVNAWGLASQADSPWWVANNATNRATVYTADGAAFAPEGSPLVVNVPNEPTGTVANSGPSFVLEAGGTSTPALFLFATEEGKILGWSPSVSVTEAVVAVDRSGEGAIHKGLAMASTTTAISCTQPISTTPASTATTPRIPGRRTRTSPRPSSISSSVRSTRRSIS